MKTRLIDAAADGELSRGQVIWNWIRYAAKLAGIFLVCFVVALLQFAWANMGRVNLPIIPGRIAADQLTADIPEASFTLDHGERFLAFELTVKYRKTGNDIPYFYYEVWVHDAAGRQIGHWLGSVSPSSETITVSMGGIGIDQPGNYKARAKLTADRNALLVDVSIHPNTNTRKSRFLVIMLIVSTGLFGALARHIYRHPLPRYQNEPDDTFESASPPSEPPIQQSLAQRVFRRLALEAVAIAVNLAWLPVLGLYFFIFAVAYIVVPEAGAAVQSTGIVDKLMTLPLAGTVLDWLDWKNNYHGWDGLVAIGLVVSKVIFIASIALTPVRLLVPNRFHPGFRGKVALLLLFTLTLVGLFAFGLQTAKLAPGTTYGGMLATMTAFCGIAFVLSLGILGLGQLIEASLTRLIDPATARKRAATR